MATEQPADNVSAPQPAANRPIVPAYRIVALAALVAVSILLVEGGFENWSLVPLLLGAIGVFWNWTSAPVLVLAGEMIMLGTQRNLTGPSWWMRPQPLVLQVLLPVANLLYVVAAMRLLALVRHTVPPDERRGRRPARRRIRGRCLLPRVATTRSTATGSAGEVGLLLSTSPLFLAAAYLISAFLLRSTPPEGYEWPFWTWRVVLLTWGIVIVLMAVWAFLAFHGRTQASTEESLLFLQDQLWSATRGEQRQINRAVARTRLRRQRKEEGA